MVRSRPLDLSFASRHFWPSIDYTLGNLESKSICSIPKFFWWYHSVEVLYKMVVPGSTLATLSITYFTPHSFMRPLHCHCCPPPTSTSSLSAAYLLPCHHHLLPGPLTAAVVVRCCSTLPPIACHWPPPPLPDAVVCQPSSQSSLIAATIV